MRKHGVEVDVIRLVDHDIATGVYPDMREHGWRPTSGPTSPRHRRQRHPVVAGPIWLGDNSSITKQPSSGSTLSGELNDKGQYLFYGRVAGC